MAHGCQFQVSSAGSIFLEVGFMKVIGMMSGTSGDSIDAAVVDFSGQPPALQWKLLKHIHLPFSSELQSEIFTCFNPKTSGVDRLCALNFALGRAYAAAALRLIAECGLQPVDIDLIGNHGQSLWHIPSGPQASTFQLGEAAVIAEETGITTIHNFRTRDMAAGGQGAPLVSYIDSLLFTHPTLSRVLQNIGGIANGTFLPGAPGRAEGQLPFAFDTGPGNMLIDDGMRRISGGAQHYDQDGRLAAQGHVHPALLEHWVAREPYFHQAPPKTTGRELFGEPYGARLWQDGLDAGLSAADYIATVTAFTARTIALAYRGFMPVMPDEVIVSGGGAYNQTLMRMLADEIAPSQVHGIDLYGLPSDAKEAVAFAVLAYETWHNRPGNLPSATGARKAVVLGSITPGEHFLR
jgi:anhydro-N-acetylmuramic acid kinase